MVQMGSRPQAAMRRGGPSLAASSSRRQLPSSVLCARILDRPACISFSESPRHISSAFVLALFVGFAFQFGFCLSFGSANSAMCAMYCVLAIVTCGYNQTTLFTTASYCRLDPSWATVTRCEWGSSVFTVVYTEGAMAIIIRVALPSSFRAASYHGGSSQLLILLVSAVRGAVPLRRRRSGAVSYLQLLHAAPPLGELIGSNLLARFSRCLS